MKVKELIQILSTLDGDAHLQIELYGHIYDETADSAQGPLWVGTTEAKRVRIGTGGTGAHLVTMMDGRIVNVEQYVYGPHEGADA